MRVAIASDDQKTLAFHLGRCQGFVMVEIEDGKEVKRWYVTNTFAHTHHFGGHGEGHHHGDHGYNHGGQGHNHQGLLDLLQGVSYVVSRGMGRRLYDDLIRHGYQPFLTRKSSVDEVIKGIASGSLRNEGENGCCVH